MDSKFKSFIISLLRRGTRRWKPANEAINAAKEIYYIKSKNGKNLKRAKFQCAECKQWFKRGEVELDHINPVVDPKIGFTTFEEYATRMYPPKEGYQVLCIKHHKEKTAKERDERKKYRQLKKNT